MPVPPPTAILPHWRWHRPLAPLAWASRRRQEDRCYGCSTDAHRATDPRGHHRLLVCPETLAQVGPSAAGVLGTLPQHHEQVKRRRDRPPTWCNELSHHPMHVALPHLAGYNVHATSIAESLLRAVSQRTGLKRCCRETSGETVCLFEPSLTRQYRRPPPPRPFGRGISMLAGPHALTPSPLCCYPLRW